MDSNCLQAVRSACKTMQLTFPEKAHLTLVSMPLSLLPISSSTLDSTVFEYRRLRPVLEVETSRAPAVNIATISR